MERKGSLIAVSKKKKKIRELSRELVASIPTNDSRDDMNVGKTQEDERI